MEHREPDRVPVALGGGPYGIVDDLYFRMLELLDLGEPAPRFREGHNISYMDDRLLERLKIDTRYVWPGDSPSSPVKNIPGTEDFLDGYGQVWKRATPYFYAGLGILANATGAEAIEEKVHWPDPDDPAWMQGVRERASYLHEQNEYFVVARMVTSHGPYQTACHLRGTEQFLLDMALDEAFALRLIERVTETIDGLLRRYLEAGGAFFDMVELPGDDYAGNTNLVMSPVMFRKFIKPSLIRLVQTVKSFRPEIKVMLHSDGMIEPLLNDLIEIGIDAVHPLEPLPAMDLERIKLKYGNRLSFLGGIDISHAMPGSRQDVIAEVKRRIAQLGPGGGYILSPANHLQADVPPENVVTLYEAAREFGEYPLEQ